MLYYHTLHSPTTALFSLPQTSPFRLFDGNVHVSTVDTIFPCRHQKTHPWLREPSAPKNADKLNVAELLTDRWRKDML